MQAAEVLITEGADRLVWVIDQFTDLIDIPGLDEDEIDEIVEDTVETLLATLFRPRA